MKTEKKMTVAGLFSGIGGFEVAFERAGFATSLICEIEPAAQEVLRFHFPDAALIDDVKQIDSIKSDVNVLCAGFPCQDLSSVGLKEGIDGSRSSLITEVFRILKANPVEWVVIENVAFMLRLKKGQAIRYITDQLSSLGYNWAYRIVDSAAFVPQRRERVYIVASLHCDPRDVLLSDDYGKSKHVYDDYSSIMVEPVGFYWTEGKYSIGTAFNAIPPLKAGSTIGIPSPPAIAFPEGFVVTPDIRDAERLQGFQADWTLPAESAAKRSVRWRLVGNAVTVDAVNWIAEKIKNPQQYNSESDNDFNREGTWPDAAWGYNGIVKASTASKWPIEKTGPGISGFLQFPTKPLSYKATSGFISRVTAGGLRTPNGFLDVLNTHKTKMGAVENGK